MSTLLVFKIERINVIKNLNLKRNQNIIVTWVFFIYLKRNFESKQDMHNGFGYSQSSMVMHQRNPNSMNFKLRKWMKDNLWSSLS